MADVRLGYSAVISGVNVVVIDPHNERVCEIPLAAAPWNDRLRSQRERLDIAMTVARLFNEESERCRKLGKVPLSRDATLEEMKA